MFRSFIPSVVWVAVITVLCLMPGDDLPKTGFFNIPYFDKIAHTGMYFILALLLFNPLKSVGLSVLPASMAFSLLLGGGLELLQHFCTLNRSGSWFDLLADLIGAFLGILVFPFVRHISTNKMQI